MEGDLVVCPSWSWTTSSFFRMHSGCCLRTKVSPHLELWNAGGVFFMAKISASVNVEYDVRDLVSDEEGLMFSCADGGDMSEISSLGLVLPRRTFVAATR